MYLHYSESHLTWKIQTSIKFFLQLSEQMAHNRKLDVSGRNCRWHIRADATFYCLFMLCLDIVYNLFEYTDDICPPLNPAIQGWIQPIMLHQTNDDNNILHKNIIWTLLVLESKLWFCPFILLCLQKETEINFGSSRHAQFPQFDTVCSQWDQLCCNILTVKALR